MILVLQKCPDRQNCYAVFMLHKLDEILSRECQILLLADFYIVFSISFVVTESYLNNLPLITWSFSHDIFSDVKSPISNYLFLFLKIMFS